VTTQLASDTDRRRDHWDATYRAFSPNQLSWQQPQPRFSLDLNTSLALPRAAAVIDVGGGASPLSDVLGGGFEVVDVRREVHTTPALIHQPFTWVAARALP
jgi:hypothetical protein